MIAVSPKELHSLLKSKGVKYLYCANSVKNSCSILKCGELISKHQLNYKKLPMTEPVNSDLEKSASVWNKTLFFICDLHGYFARQNKHGPVCFVMDIDFLLEIHEKDLYITKRNPINWKKHLKQNQICYSSVAEFAEEFDSLLPERRAHKNIILVRDKKSIIDLKKYLVKIILDKPAHRHLLFLKAQEALKSALEKSELTNVPLKIRNCKDFCFCETNYGEMTIEEIEALFLP